MENYLEQSQPQEPSINEILEGTTKQIIRKKIEKLKNRIEERQKIKDSNLKQIRKEIKTQQELFDKNLEDETAIRKRLEQLYQDLRKQKTENWKDLQQTKNRKRELEAELQELKQLDQL